ncbi:AI-2E family transporter [Aliifodinibius sp. S!AR15-10]|uniref:AI-2E family transporter n=1 Tax=Aliifodinibius sp. S!AR15-10 TaxID=2950437 RepID=UPI002855A290|nr:AI-2E family transporter [Aliifodinibius sp. S!AR15-10]MDR8390102.1 AI-2E family transporter [Aliifodinibius sp. S!AR15-10]
MDNYSTAVRALIRLLLAFAIIAALIITKNLLVPFFLSVLFAYMLYPAAERLEGHGIPRIATNFILIIVSLSVVIATLYLIAVLITTFSQDLPQIREQFQENMKYVQYALGDLIGVSKAQQDAIMNNLGNTGQYLRQFFTATANSILAIGLIPVYTFLLLFYRNKFREFISQIVTSEQEDTVQNIIDQAAEVVPKYMKGLFLVCLILVGLNSLGFYLIGVKYALLFGIVAALFNLIPYLGTVIGYGLVFIFVLSTQSPGLALGVIIQFFIIQFLENNILTPNITGSYVKINPLVTILSLIAGGMIWGLPGMFLIIPYLAMLKIVCENIEHLKPIGFLLGTRGTERYDITLASIKRRFGWKE